LQVSSPHLDDHHISESGAGSEDPLNHIIDLTHSKDCLMARRNYQYEKRQKELAKKKKKEDKRLRKLEKKESEALADGEIPTEEGAEEATEIETTEVDTEDAPEDPTVN
jgi:mRNA degradation ribonuclease J1/J2